MSAPVVTGLKKTVLLSNSIAGSELFTAFDSDDAIVNYFVQDFDRRPTSGYFTFNGSAIPQGTFFKLSASDLPQLRYVGGNQVSSERVRIIAQDLAGNFSSNSVTSTLFSARANTTAPYARAKTFNLVANESIAASEIVWGYDPDGHPIESFSIRDRSDDAGHFELNGTAKPQGVFFTVSTDQLAGLSYVTTGVTKSELFDVIAFDGVQNSPRSVGFANTIVNANRPEVRFSRAQVLGGEPVAISDVLDVSDADGNTIKKYRFLNDSNDPASGKLIFKGIVQPRRTWIEVKAADLDEMRFVAANRSATQSIRALAFDGKNWSNENTIAITSFVRPKFGALSPEVVAEQLETVKLSDVFVRVDDGFASTKYEVFKPGNDPAGGKLFRGLNPIAGGQIHEFSAADWATGASFTTGAFLDREIDTIYVRSFNGSVWGAWEKQDIRTEPEFRDVLEGGSHWNDPGILRPSSDGKLDLSFSFFQQSPGDYPTGVMPPKGFEILSSLARASIRTGLRHLETLANVRFTEIQDSSFNVLGQSGGIMRFGGYSDDADTAAAFAYFPSRATVAGDMWFNSALMNTDLPFGELDYMIFLHELGHAMGMKHPHSGVPRLPPSTDTNAFTVMSYNVLFDAQPTTYGLYDISTLQDFYGANKNYNSGNDVYSIHRTWRGQQNFFESIWDSGGTDLLSAVGSQGPAIVDLRSGNASTIGLEPGDVTISFGTVIENGIGSKFDDRMIGNSSNNYLDGGDGDDYLKGGKGNDYLVGGKGNDIYEFGVADNSDIIDEKIGNGRDTLLISDFPGIDSLENDFQFRMMGDDLIVDLTLNGGFSEGNVRIKNQTNLNSRIETLEFNGVRVDLIDLSLQATAVDQNFRILSTSSANGFLVAPV